MSSVKEVFKNSFLLLAQQTDNGKKIRTVFLVCQDYGIQHILLIKYENQLITIYIHFLNIYLYAYLTSLTIFVLNKMFKIFNLK